MKLLTAVAVTIFFLLVSSMSLAGGASEPFSNIPAEQREALAKAWMLTWRYTEIVSGTSYTT